MSVAEQAGLCFTWSYIPSQSLREKLIRIRAVLSVFDKTVSYIIGMCLSEVSRLESYRILYLLDKIEV